MTTRQTLAKIRALLRSRERADVRQGVEIARALDDPEITAALGRGLEVDASGALRWSDDSEIRRRVRPAHRLAAAIGILEIQGRLGEVRQIAIPGEATSLAEELALARGCALEQITWSRAGPLVDLSPVAWFPGLRWLALLGASGLRDLGPLAAMTSLETLALISSGVADLSPLAGLAGLRRLDLSHSAQIADLSPLAGLTRLESLRLERLSRVRDLSPLSGLTRLRTLSIAGCSLEDLSPLAGLSGLLEGLRVDATGVPRDADGRLVAGERLLALLLVRPPAGAHPLQSATALSLRGARGLRSLALIAEMTELESLDVSDCPNLEDPRALVGMPRLETLRALRCERLSPRPRRLVMEGRQAVDAYQRRLAMALSVAPERSPAEATWLARARAAGLLETRRDLWREPALAPIAAQLASDAPERAQAGVIALAGLDAITLNALARGLAIDDRGRLQITGTASLPRGAPPAWTALAILRAAGRLDELTTLSIESQHTLADLAPLGALPGRPALPLLSLVVLVEREIDLSAAADLPDLYRLEIREGRPLDIAPLAPLTDLQRLTLPQMYELTDLSPLAGMARLERLEMASCLALEDLSGLLGLTALRHLSISSMRARDLSPLSGLTDLEHLELSWAARLQDLSPLSGLTGLRSLDLRCARSLRDLSPLASLPALEELQLEGCDALPEAARGRHRSRRRIAALLG